MFSGYESEDSENYDDPSYWFQVGHQNLEKAGNLNSNFGGKILESEEDDVVLDSDDNSNSMEKSDEVDLQNQIQNPEDYQIIDEEVIYTPEVMTLTTDSEESEEADFQNQNPEDYEILEEEVIYTPEDVTMDSEDVTITTEYPQIDEPSDDHTYCRPDSEGARIEMVIDEVVRQNRFRRRRDVQHPPRQKSRLYHQTRGAIPYTRKVPIKLGPMEIERWSFLIVQSPLIWPPDFHGFSSVQLCYLACRNSPTGMVSTKCAVNFVLHHFPHYRFNRLFTIDRIRNALRRKTLFQTITVAEKKRIMFAPVTPVNLDITEDQFLAMDMDPRGRAFFDRMLRGELGLPRQLFYHVIGSQCPPLAGPENSALFYHLLSIGHIPSKGSTHFKIHPEPCLAVEPRFLEEQELYPSGRSVRDVEKLEYFGVNGMKSALDSEYSNRFFAWIFAYFESQHFLKSSGLKNWETPSVPF